MAMLNQETPAVIVYQETPVFENEPASKFERKPWKLLQIDGNSTDQKLIVILHWPAARPGLQSLQRAGRRHLGALPPVLPSVGQSHGAAYLSG